MTALRLSVRGVGVVPSVPCVPWYPAAAASMSACPRLSVSFRPSRAFRGYQAAAASLSASAPAVRVVPSVPRAFRGTQAAATSLSASAPAVRVVPSVPCVPWVLGSRGQPVSVRAGCPCGSVRPVRSVALRQPRPACQRPRRLSVSFRPSRAFRGTQAAAASLSASAPAVRVVPSVPCVPWYPGSRGQPVSVRAGCPCRSVRPVRSVVVRQPRPACSASAPAVRVVPSVACVPWYIRQRQRIGARCGQGRGRACRRPPGLCRCLPHGRARRRYRWRRRPAARLEVLQPDGTGRRRRSADAGPRVQSDVMVIAAGRDEQRARTVSLHQLEAEHVDVEARRRPRAATRAGARDRSSVPRASPAPVVASARREDVEVQRIGAHLQRAADERPFARADDRDRSRCRCRRDRRDTALR